ncbi:MAG: F0F1 ATP synthase subunit alpha, partial [Succinivibrio sp.]
NHGQKVTELMKQPQYSPLSVAEQALVIFAAERGFLEDVDIKKVAAFEKGLLSFGHSNYGEFMDSLEAKPDYNDDIVKKLTEIVTEFKSTKTY